MKQVIHTDKAPAAIGPYSQAIQIGQLLFTSGRSPLTPRPARLWRAASRNRPVSL